jgi:hypothetical protein
LTARTARCSCGSLTAEAEGEPVVVVLCNCQECQRRTGSPFGVAAFYEADKVRVSGDTKSWERVVEDRKLSFRFCPTCGSTVYWHTDNHPGRVAIAAGAFADPHFPKPARSVFEEFRHDWITMPDEIPGLVAGRGSAPSR